MSTPINANRVDTIEHTAAEEAPSEHPGRTDSPSDGTAVPVELRGLLRSRSITQPLRSRSPVLSQEHAIRRWATLPPTSLDPHEILDGLLEAAALPEDHPSCLYISEQTLRRLAENIPGVPKTPDLEEVERSAVAAMEPGGSGERWQSIADRAGIIGPMHRRVIESAVARGPALSVATAALQADGSGEPWNRIADRMHVSSIGGRFALQAAIAAGPVAELAIAAMQPGGSGERWNSLADRLAIDAPACRNMIEDAVTHGPAADAVIKAMTSGGSRERWDSIATRMGITSVANREFLSKLDLGRLGNMRASARRFGASVAARLQLRRT
jgi:hypothetical protein